MTKQEMAVFNEILETKKADLSRVLRKREDIAIEKSPDALDEVTRAAERELAIRNLDRDSAMLRNVKAALSRIRDGSYGTCVHCEEPISPKRLQAVPWTPFCIKCQEAFDRNEQEAVEAFEDLLVNAA